MTAPGIFEWTSPHGHRYRRDHTGTTALDPPDPAHPGSRHLEDDPAPHPATHEEAGPQARPRPRLACTHVFLREVRDLRLPRPARRSRPSGRPRSVLTSTRTARRNGAWVEPAGWGGPSLWFQKVREAKVAKNRQHFDLRAMGPLAARAGPARGAGRRTVLQDDDPCRDARPGRQRVLRRGLTPSTVGPARHTRSMDTAALLTRLAEVIDAHDWARAARPPAPRLHLSAGPHR